MPDCVLPISSRSSIAAEDDEIENAKPHAARKAEREIFLVDCGTLEFPVLPRNRGDQ